MTDSLGLDFMKFSVGALVRALWDSERDGLPSFMNHDCTRLLGWNKPSTVYFEPGLTRVVGTVLMPQTKEETADIEARYRRMLWTQLEEHQASELAELRARLAPHTDGSEKPLCREAAALVGRGLAVRCFPSLFDASSLDGDGLIELGKLNPVGAGVFQIDNLLVFAHKFLRRSFHPLNSLNSPFLDALQSIDVKGLQKKIKLDPDTVGLASSFKGNVIERSYWWGPSFNDSIPDIDAGVYHREASEEERVFFPVSATECFWYHRDDFHNFEAEELRDSPSYVEGAERYLCRYAHAMVPAGEVDPSHFDGAVRGYTGEDMIQRLETDLMHAPRQSEYVKLWRIDGPLPNSDWKRLLSDYYRDNTHVGEYLGGTPGEGILQKLAEPPTQEVKAHPVPYRFQDEDGIRVGLSFRQPLSLGDHPFTLLPSKGTEVDNRKVDILDIEAMDFAKLIQRRGQHIQLPDDFIFEVCYDAYSVLQPIYHRDHALLKVSVKALLDLITARLLKQPAFVTAFSFRFPIGEKDAILSVAGNGSAVQKWLASEWAVPPDDLEALVQWAEAVAPAFFGDDHSNGPQHEKLMGVNGEFLFDRGMLLEETYELFESDGALCYRLTPSLSKDIRDDLEAGRYSFGLGTCCSTPMCRRCEKPYSICPCVRWIDEMDGIECAPDLGHFGFWTDRPIL